MRINNPALEKMLKNSVFTASEQMEQELKKMTWSVNPEEFHGISVEMTGDMKLTKLDFPTDDPVLAEKVKAAVNAVLEQSANERLKRANQLAHRHGVPGFK